MFNYNISHFHPIPFKYGKSSNLTRCRLSDDLWAEKRRAQGKKPKHSDHANVSLPPIHPLSWHYSTPIHSVPLAVHGNVAHVSLGSNFPPPPLSARYRLGRTKRRQHQNQAAVSWPPPLSLYNQPRRRFMHTHTHTHTQSSWQEQKEEANGCCWCCCIATCCHAMGQRICRPLRSQISISPTDTHTTPLETLFVERIRERWVGKGARDRPEDETRGGQAKLLYFLIRIPQII